MSSILHLNFLLSLGAGSFSTSTVTCGWYLSWIDIIENQCRNNCFCQLKTSRIFYDSPSAFSAKVQEDLDSAMDMRNETSCGLFERSPRSRRRVPRSYDRMQDVIYIYSPSQASNERGVMRAGMLRGGGADI